MKNRSLPARRPAETTTVVAGAIVALLAKPLGIDTPEEVAAATIIVGSIPSVVTYIVSTLRGR